MQANVVVMGTESVGKTALTVRLLTRRFIGEYGDIDSVYSHRFIVDGREIAVNIWDSPYSQDISVKTMLLQRKLQWANGFILAYSICDRASFNAVVRLVHAIKSSRGCPKAPVAIVGNKRDLHHRRTVASEEGRQLAINAGCLFYEVSAAENYHGVLAVFHGLIGSMRDAKRPPGLKGIVKSVSAVFTRRRTDSI
ncbi:ras-related and estrogen-regulated growth inhibitor-like protein [Corythoichthys intestinalis]|uniref:ras-related and estrogen-regulated growth inhibitor-like protein n=1 Tax=Corythoichthys intestinalis TaxID=161448 RepID=UPI0025A568C3|nr:ras-related and estrogen-regulated growth inhibitor-like protein [Corythoichthys intestinalis]XP_061813217.1 ras-related and estrogen-regulated growth inhibitor-like protein [Nerophis lumbriciformis]